ncbi:hypothetical protein [Streptomyces sp. bgisy027]|uniref:hypothetical protein n=1 Tax=Streptomyces sp. bgisy027 TaxID=3413770 RepID=UPI003D74FA4D
MSIIHALVRRILDVLAPGTGRRRAVRRNALPVAAPGATAPRATPPPWPSIPRSPYGLDTPLDGTASPLVRPYLVAVERERRRQSQGRITLVLATDCGTDLDQHIVGTQGAV